MSMLASPPSAPSDVADSLRDRIVREKTVYWQASGPAETHLRVSGVRPRGLFAPVCQKMLSYIAPNSRVLDVGCGHGRLSIPMAEAGHRVVATDVSRKMLDLLVQHADGLPIEVRQADAHCLPAKDGEFDVVLSSDFLPHFPDWGRLLEEQARACRAGGLIMFGFNFREHRTYAEPFGGDKFDHPYSPEPASNKPFWAECPVAEMVDTGARLGLEAIALVPVKYLHESYAFGGALGASDYQAFKMELDRRLEANAEVAEFFVWLERDLFQRMPFFAAYHSLVVFRKKVSGGPSGGDPVETPDTAAPAPVLADDTFLSLIPSETSLAERRFLFEYFARRWSGTGAVVEIGPFLGGTTRAIAAGMAANPRRAPGAALHTFDRFDAYYSASQLRATIEPLVQNGTFSASRADDLCRDANFERLFGAIHAGHDYHRLVNLHNSPLPDTPEELGKSEALKALQDVREVSAVFVDGCKSWASTRYALESLLPRLRVGNPVIFQDYGWYTCFWISSAVHALRDFLTPLARVDSTYAFNLSKPIAAEDVAGRFSPTPDGMGSAFFREAAAAQFESSQSTGDLRGELVSRLHLVAALMTLGLRDEAASVLKSIEVKRYAAYAYMISGCLKSPTYLPGGKKILWA